MKHLIIVSLLLLLTMGAAFGNFAGRVKAVRNCRGLRCLEIPGIVEKELGFQVSKRDWREEKMGDAVKVTLKISAQKEVMVNSVYMSYSWNPEWVWRVNPLNGKITPLNDRARDWMDGKL